MNVEERPPFHTENAQQPVVTREVGDGESVTNAVVTAVSTATDAGVSELPPLYDSLDPDALEGIFSTLSGGAERRCDGRVVFEYGGYEVHVESSGLVRLYRPKT